MGTLNIEGFASEVIKGEHLTHIILSLSLPPLLNMTLKQEDLVDHNLPFK